MEVVGDAGNARDAVFEVRAPSPMSSCSTSSCRTRAGSRCCRGCCTRRRRRRCLMLSMQDDPSYVREAFAAGASGYVLKEAADAEVVAAMREVAAGGRYVHPALGARMVAADAAGAGGRGRRSALGSGAGGAAAAGARPHEPGDREAALHLGAHGRDPPRAHHAEAAARDARRARALRARARPARPSLRRLRGRELPGEAVELEGPGSTGRT